MSHIRLFLGNDGERGDAPCEHFHQTICQKFIDAEGVEIVGTNGMALTPEEVHEQDLVLPNLWIKHDRIAELGYSLRGARRQCSNTGSWAEAAGMYLCPAHWKYLETRLEWAVTHKRNRAALTEIVEGAA